MKLIKRIDWAFQVVDNIIDDIFGIDSLIIKSNGGDMVSILMATHNGEQYLKEQLDSILSQSVQSFKIIVNDDASTDSTWEILQEYAKTYPQKFVISRSSVNSGSAKFNFLGMMSSVHDKYVMLCDQDDVWLPDKIERTLEKMICLESKNKGKAVLVRSDMHVVNEKLEVISNSYKSFMHSSFSRTNLNQVLIQNSFAGCSAMYNSELAKLLTRKPDYCIMHDWWLELVASAFGVIGDLDAPTVLYRQHDNNEIGASNVRSVSYKINRLINYKRIITAIEITYAQAESFLKCYRNELTVKQKKDIDLYCRIPNKSKFGKIITILKLGSFKNGLARNIAYFIFV